MPIQISDDELKILWDTAFAEKIPVRILFSNFIIFKYYLRELNGHKFKPNVNNFWAVYKMAEIETPKELW